MTNELAFDDSAAAHEFLTKYGAAAYIPEPPSPTFVAKPISISLTAPPKIKRQSAVSGDAMQVDKKIDSHDEEKRIIVCKAAQSFIMAASQTFQKVDIKVRTQQPAEDEGF